MKQSWTRRQISLVVLLLTSIIAIIWWVSRSELEANGLQPNITLVGKINGAGGLLLYLEAPSDRGTISIAQTEINEDGSFELPAHIPGLGIFNLRLSDLNGSMLWLPLEPKDNLQLKANLRTFASNPKISGVSWAKAYAELMQATKRFESIQVKLQAAGNSTDEQAITDAYNQAKNEYETFCTSTILKDLKSPLNILLSMNLLPTTGFEDWNVDHLRTLEKLSTAYAKHYAGQPASNNMQGQFQQIEDAYFAYTQTINGSMTAPEISLPDPRGVTHNLSALKGKYVLIDFWASWCGPCKSEMPNVIALYNKYKNKGFAVFSVSLDDNQAKWQAAIASWGMTWPDHVSDLKGWNSTMPNLYHFDGIPYTVLLNPEGKIIGTNLRGKKLQDKLASLFQ